MRTRRKFLSGVGATFGVVSLAGCAKTNVSGNFKLLDIGLVEKGGDIAAYIEVENIGSKAYEFIGWLATYDSDGVRVSDWYVVRDEVEAGTRRRLYVVFESGDSGWADSNDIGQVVNSHTAKFRLHNATKYEPKGNPYGEDDIGKTF